jgi:hypothetical protein
LEARLHVLENQLRSVDAERSSGEVRLSHLMGGIRSSLSLAMRQYAELAASGTESADTLDTLRTRIAKGIAEFQVRTGEVVNWEAVFLPRARR